MKLTIVNQDSGYLMIDIANAYCKIGYKVSLITGRLNQRSTPLDSGVEVRHIIKYNRSNSLKRVFTWSLAALQILFLLWFRYRNHRLLLVSNPPFAPLLPIFTRNIFDLLIYDIYPDALAKMGYLSSNHWFYRFWARKNRTVFRKARRIITISDGMKKVLSNYAQAERIEVIPVWSDNNFLKPIVKVDNPFVIKYNLIDKFVVMYSGNLGLSHSVDIIPEIARLVTNPRIIFLIIGEGEGKILLEKKIGDYGLSNVMVLPYQPVNQLPFSLSSADLAVVTLIAGASTLSVPSKTFSFLSVGSPILSIATDDSELALLTKEYDFGRCFPANNIQEIVDFIEQLAVNSELAARYKNNAQKASRCFDIDLLCKRFVNDN